MKTYISGKISGLLAEEVEARFQKAQEYLEKLGFKVINPASDRLVKNYSLEKALMNNLQKLLKADSVYMLENWTDSVQAQIEHDIAKRMNKKIFFESYGTNELITVTKIKDAIKEVTRLDFDEYTIKNRKTDLFYARMLFVHKCKENGIEPPVAAKIIKRDRTTVLYMIKKYDEEVKFNPKFRRMAEKLNEIMQ